MSKLRFTAFFLVASLHGCASDAPDPRREVLRLWGNGVIMPWYQDFETKALALQQACDSLCDAPTKASAQAAQQAWWQVRAPWKQSEVIAFGPIKKEPLRLGPKIDFWPARPDNIKAVLEDQAPIDLKALGAPSKGQVAIEFLLFEHGEETGDAFSQSPRRCEYLTALCTDHAAQATHMRQAWDPAEGNYLGELTDAGWGSTDFPTVQMALSEVLSRMAHLVENIRLDKIDKPLGNAAPASPKPDKVESPFSDRSIQDILDNLAGIDALTFGPEGALSGLSFDAYARQRGHDFGPSMRAALDASREALLNIARPLDEAVVDDGETVEQASERLAELQRLIQVDIVGGLGLSFRFNDKDGD